MGNRLGTFFGLAALLICGAALGEPDQGESAFETRRAARAAALEAFKAARAEPFVQEDPSLFQPFELTRVRTNLRVGSEIGDYSPPGLLGPCQAKDDETLQFAQERDDLDHIDIYDVFFEVMDAAGYRLAGDPNALFPDDSERARAVYQIGAEVVALDFRLCEAWDFWNPFDDDDGEGFGTLALTVVWHLYDRKQREVVAKVITVGRAVLEESTEFANEILARRAFADAARHLSRDALFQSVLQRDAAAPSREVAEGEAGGWTIARRARFDGGIELLGPRLVDATVTVLLGDGHASGFFISEDGLVLTNEHVVGAAETVILRLSNGTEVEAEVLARHKGRDAALLRAAISRAPALPLRLERPAVGETVYSIGAPFEEDFSGTIRQGIVSAFRVREDQLWLQSDVAVNQGNSGGPLVDAEGNVVAMTSWGRLGDAGEETALNFFAPVADALDALGVVVEAPGEEAAGS